MGDGWVACWGGSWAYYTAPQPQSRTTNDAWRLLTMMPKPVRELSMSNPLGMSEKRIG